MQISLIVAHGPNGEIGLNNKLLWHIKEDLQHFKKLTLNKPIIMGRKTFESIGKALPNRINIVLTRDSQFIAENVTVIHEPNMVFDYVLSLENEKAEDLELMICGGEEIYKIFLPYAYKIYRTLVDYKGPADAYFPKIDENLWQISESRDEFGLKFQTLIKNS